MWRLCAVMWMLCVQYSYCERRSRESVIPLLCEGYVQQVIDTCCHIVQCNASIKVTNWIQHNITTGLYWCLYSEGSFHTVTVTTTLLCLQSISLVGSKQVCDQLFKLFYQKNFWTDCRIVVSWRINQFSPLWPFLTSFAVQAQSCQLKFSQDNVCMLFSGLQRAARICPHLNRTSVK